MKEPASGSKRVRFVSSRFPGAGRRAGPSWRWGGPFALVALVMTMAFAATPPAEGAASGASSADGGHSWREAAFPNAVDPGERAPVVLFRGATIWTMGPEGVIGRGDLLIRDGKIAEVGAHVEPPAGALVVNATGMHITPGLIDCHSHIAAEGDINEGSDNVTSEVRIADVLDPYDIAIYRQLAGGLTTSNILHGSANSIGGQNAVIKLRWGLPAADLVFAAAPPGIKFALGENPKQSNFRLPGDQRYPATRMGVAASIRKAFLEAQDYRREWSEYEALSPKDRQHREPPRRDLRMEALVEVLEGKRLVHAHSYRQDEILMLIRLAEEMGFRIATFQHVLEGYKVADEIAAHGAGASTFSDWWAYKFEVYDAIPYNGALMDRRGVLTSFNSDSEELARRLNLEAAKAVKYGGLSPERALALVTINPAEQLRIDGRVGSIERGKDADLAVWSGDPLSTYTVCEQTWVDGIERFDRTEDLAARSRFDREREEMIAAVKRETVGGPAPTEDTAKSMEAESGSGPVGQMGTTAAKPEPAAGSSAAAPSSREPLTWHVPPGWTHGWTALVGATVHTVSGPDIEAGTVLVEDGRIEAVGTDIPIPPDAEVIPLRGLHLYPGMMDANSILGLTEIDSVPGSVDLAETGEMNPSARAEIAVNPDSELIPVARANGLTHVLTAPRGGIVSGTSALIRLDGWTWEDLSAASPVAMHVQYPSWEPVYDWLTGRTASKVEARKNREEALERLEELFESARAYRLALDASRTGGKPPRHDPALEALVPVLDGRIPVVVHANEIRQIRHAVAWARREQIRMVLAGGADSWMVTDLLKENGIPVILGPVLALPSRRHEAYDSAYALASRLYEAGVEFCISTGGDGFNARNLPYHAAMAAAYGLPREEALRAVTLYPARILGAGRELGSIEPGKRADLIVTDGDPLEIPTQVSMVFIEGRSADLSNRHRGLYERYASRPKPATEPTAGSR